MALNKEYFDAIDINIVKQKYYNANKVQAVFNDIQTQAEALYAENEQMKLQLAAYNGRKSEISDAVISAQSIYQEIVAKANARAAEIVAQAEQERDEILSQAGRQQDYALQGAQRLYSQVREQYQAGIEALNSQWQAFLCGLYQDDEPEENTPLEPGLPEDLSEKVDAIAKELFSI